MIASYSVAWPRVRSLGPFAHHVHGHPFALEAALEKAGELLLVFCDQHSHCATKILA